MQTTPTIYQYIRSSRTRARRASAVIPGTAAPVYTGNPPFDYFYALGRHADYPYDLSIHSKLTLSLLGAAGAHVGDRQELGLPQAVQMPPFARNSLPSGPTPGLPRECVRVLEDRYAHSHVTSHEPRLGLEKHLTERSQAAKEKGETVMAAKGPLSVAFNPFACLPEEQLDETTGELIVTKGVDIFEADEEEKSSVDEYEYEAVGRNDTIKEDIIRVAMKQLDREHILRTSREIFEVFKVYGMAVLSERLSLSLALPHVSLRLNKQSEMVTPARLTRQRQRVLSVANLAKCAVSLGIAELIQGNEHEAARLQEEYGLANTLRAFVGFYSAVATTSTPSNRPMAMMQSVGEARVFINSKACDELHAPGERPASDAALERRRQPSLLLRQCIDSTRLETLFETLNKEQEAQRQRSEAAPSLRKRRPKKKKTVDGFAATAGCVTRNLERFLHRRFLFCLEEIVVLFAQRKTEACRAQIAVFEHDVEPCAELPHFRKWEVSTSTLTLAMRDSFFRMLLHDVCQFHAVISTSRNARDGTRITQLRLPLHYTWSNIDTRITTEQQARS
ncbi:uncharacterized protein PITG_15081 [Phytophthora infestans T30-4]|uniref:Uncharacterized protein n=1 Tax=Phytophthora infestans (strain T30-4) TaxID=403677 RepID=D0NRL8_PHYIT|nr:uncharacterized protein PITG_15081 [Phytophthora infestans T30-4]EEY63368.1 conserved hypothetical protein [Phytophthora infestans T30-4]|eukprot:XP_002898253.1 conserved hypothetical protein [Phytophthora infestans T30-4]